MAVKEGMEAWRGEGCCVTSPIPGEPADELRSRLLRALMALIALGAYLL